MICTHTDSMMPRRHPRSAMKATKYTTTEAMQNVAAAAILTLKVQRNRTKNAKTSEYTTVNEAADLSSSTVSARTHVSLD